MELKAYLHYVWYCWVITMTRNKKVLHSRIRYLKACMRYVRARMKVLALKITRPYRLLYYHSKRYIDGLVLIAEYQNDFYNWLQNINSYGADALKDIIAVHDRLVNGRQDPHLQQKHVRWEQRVAEAWLQKCFLYLERKILSRDIYDTLFCEGEVC